MADYSRETMELACGEVVEVTFKDGTIKTGWLVPGVALPQKIKNAKNYTLLPLNVNECTLSFGKSYVKSMKYVYNNFVIPKNSSLKLFR